MPLPSDLRTLDDVAAAISAGYDLRDAEMTPKVAPIKDATPFIVINGKIEYLERTFVSPNRESGTIQYCDAKSFVKAYMGAEKDPDGKFVVYGSLEPAKFTAVFNDHGTRPGFRDYRAELVLKHSREWNDWISHNTSKGAFAGNEEFAYFVENHASDFTNPTGGAMLEMALNFSVKSSMSFKNAIRLQDGKVELQYSEVVDGTVTPTGGGQKMKVPELFTIDIPVFAGLDEPRYSMEARFRFRCSNGKLSIWYDIVEPHKAIETAFRHVLEEIQTGIGADVLFGVA